MFGPRLNYFGALLGSSVIRLASGRIVEHNRRSEACPFRPVHSAVKCRQAPKLVLRPTLERMVVALCAIQPPAEEDANILGHHFLRTGFAPIREKVA